MNSNLHPDLVRSAELLDHARVTREPTTQDRLGTLPSLQSAYDIQSAGVALRTHAGDKACGLKMGFTSRAKMAQMGVFEMIIGQLTSTMRVPDGGSLDTTAFIHPRVEPEIAFLLGNDLPVDAEADDFIRCVDAVAPALEIIDSRYTDFRFDLNAVVADNTSAAAFVVGGWRKVSRDIDNLGLSMAVVDEDPTGARTAVQSGTTAAILGNPWRSLDAAAHLAARHRIAVPAGSILLAGAATAALPLPTLGRVDLEVSGLGRMRFWLSEPSALH